MSELDDVDETHVSLTTLDLNGRNWLRNPCEQRLLPGPVSQRLEVDRKL
jgi:hypothetical protein